MPEFDDFVNAVGLMCELMRLYRDELMKNGFTREESCAIALAFAQFHLKGGGSDA